MNLLFPEFINHIIIMYLQTMKNICMLAIAAMTGIQSYAVAEKQIIRISTNQTDLVLQVAPNGRLYQTYLGEKLLHETDLEQLEWNIHPASDASVIERGWEVCSTSGNEDFFEPAWGITHSDGNPSTWLYYVSSSTKSVEGGMQTDILLRDDKYPVDVTLHYVTYPEENIIKTWSEIKHEEKKPISLFRYASTMLYFSNPSYYLTEFSGDWAKEVQMSNQQLQFGKKIIDTKLGSRAAMHAQPFFMLGLGQPVNENTGNVLMGTIGWTGNFRFTFEIDNVGNLRVIPSINPYASTYELAKGETFTTPEFIFTLSKGTGEGSRNFQRWARNYQIKDGKGSRMTLLNNWENTAFDFDESMLAELMKEAKDLGVDMFLLDDGWFGNKYSRNNDKAGLGDWDANKQKLPNGVPALIRYAKEAGVQFGIWIEPEMINPQSELMEKHPEWAIRYPNRDTYYYRNQLVLDMSNPEIQDYVYNVIDKLMTENPELAYFKWDCNSPITNIYSPYLKNRQGRLYIDHIRGVYNVMKRVSENYPKLPLMLCSGGGARCDYEALKHFTEFWCSDNTDPVERVYIQWGFSHFFPAKSMCAHVTSWNKNASIKFRTDVASMGKLGFDLGLKELTANELLYCQQAISNWKRLSTTILEGEQYRLVSPYTTQHMAVNYVNTDQTKAVLFAYDIYPRFEEKLFPVKLHGLHPNKMYQVKEINLMPGEESTLRANGKVFSGDYLMKIGLDVLGFKPLESHVIELTEQQ